MKLAIKNRSITGKQVRNLRKEDIIPGVVYGRHLEEPVSVSFDRIQLLKAIRKAWTSTPVVLKGDGEEHLVLFHDIQFHPVSDAVLHVDCLAVNKNEVTYAEVHLKLVGESPFEENSLGRVQLLIDMVEVEALPLDLPHDIEVDISWLDHDGQILHLRDLVVSDKVTLLGDPDLAIASTIAFREEVEEEEEVEDTTEATEETSEEA